MVAHAIKQSQSTLYQSLKFYKNKIKRTLRNDPKTHFPSIKQPPPKDHTQTTLHRQQVRHKRNINQMTTIKEILSLHLLKKKKTNNQKKPFRVCVCAS